MYAIRSYYAALALLLGTISGYPVGARITADLRKNKLISKNEAERLVAFTNNSGPIFIAGAVATGMLMDAKLGSILLTCHILGAVSVVITSYSIHYTKLYDYFLTTSYPYSSTCLQCTGTK